MVARIREWCRSESLGIVLPVGFILLFATWQLLARVAQGLIYPFLRNIFEDDDDAFFGGIDTEGGGVTIDVGFAVMDLIALLMLGALVYWLFVRPIRGELDEEDATRECPECLSEIMVEARRCAFCSAEVTPVSGAGPGDA